jgi:hypothetical protein
LSTACRSARAPGRRPGRETAAIYAPPASGSRWIRVALIASTRLIWIFIADSPSSSDGPGQGRRISLVMTQAREASSPCRPRPRYKNCHGWHTTAWIRGPTTSSTRTSRHSLGPTRFGQRRLAVHRAEGFSASAMSASARRSMLSVASVSATASRARLPLSGRPQLRRGTPSRRLSGTQRRVAGSYFAEANCEGAR